MFKSNKATFISASMAWGLTVAILPIAPSAQAATFTYTGTTIDGPTFNRPVANFSNPPTAIAGPGGAMVSYSTFSFNVTAPDSYVFQSTATSANFDNFTVLYQNSFNPADSVANAIIANDDNPSIGLSGFTTSLNPGINYFLITTGFQNTDAGTFSNTIAGTGNVLPGPIAAVPEPATILGSLAAFGYGVYSRRKIKIDRSVIKKVF